MFLEPRMLQGGEMTTSKMFLVHAITQENQDIQEISSKLIIDRGKKKLMPDFPELAPGHAEQNNLKMFEINGYGLSTTTSARLPLFEN